jgi:hypothetical protein
MSESESDSEEDAERREAEANLLSGGERVAKGRQRDDDRDE